MILLDTNVASVLMSQVRDTRVDDWLNKAVATDLFLPAIVVLEIKYGIDVLDRGKRQRELDVAFDRLVRHAFKDRIVPFDLDAAIAAAAIVADRERRGRTAGAADAMIGGIGVSRRATIATRNIKHFSDLPLTIINPWNGA